MRRLPPLRWMLPGLGALAALAVLGTVLFCSSRPSRAEKPVVVSGTSQGVPATFFGMHFHYAGAVQKNYAPPTEWPKVGIGSWRFWNAYTAWTNLEPRPGAWDFGNFDKSMAVAEENHAEPLVVLAMTPHWASTRPDEHSPYGPGASAEPADLDDWRHYVRKVVRRYKGQVPYYEIWNEPDLRETYTGTPEKMAEITRAACEVIRATDPAARIVGPALTSGDHAFPWYERFLKAMGPKPCFDVMGWHFYTAESPPERLIDVMAKLRAMRQKHGIDSMPIWNTESGYFIENDDGPRVAGTIGDPDKLILNTELTTAYLMRSMILGWSLGIERFYWYAWDDEELGLREPKTRRVKRAGVAYGTLTRWMQGAVLSNCVNNAAQVEGLWRCDLKKSGREGYLVWSTKGWRKVSLPAAWQVTAFEDDSGASMDVPAGTLAVGQVPLLLKREKTTWR